MVDVTGFSEVRVLLPVFLIEILKDFPQFDKLRSGMISQLFSMISLEDCLPKVFIALTCSGLLNKVENSYFAHIFLQDSIVKN